MRLSARLLSLGLLAQSVAANDSLSRNSTYYNPVLPGWHSDPSCVQVDGTFYCVTSTFISFPGLPIYATNGQQEGMFAASIRHRRGVFYVICEYLGVPGKNSGVLFTTTDPLDDDAWSNPVTFVAPKIDPDLFWDDDDGGKTYVATQGIQLQEFDTLGPHLYKHGAYYYLLIAEGGTALDHSITIARARNLTGPYTPHPRNPILTNRGSAEYFQTVGHGDLFRDARGSWWGMALATRSGPEYRSYPMGREAVLFPVTWEDGDDGDVWTVLQPVRGKMEGWPLPEATRDVPGEGPFNGDPDVYDFGEGHGGGGIPRNLVHWRVPRQGAFSLTKKGLQVVLGRNRLDGLPGGTEEGAGAISFVGRRQTHSLFSFSVDLEFAPRAAGHEAGITAFLTQAANIQLGVVLVGKQLSFRYNASGVIKTSPVPDKWAGKPLRLKIDMTTPAEYTFAAMPAGEEKSRVVLGTASSELLSGGTGSFVGTLIGVYATCNGAGSGLDCPAGTPNAYVKRWRYMGEAQYVSATDKIPVKKGNPTPGW
ncbi:glycosyl hydrolase [Staphylotrichum tortipilum]|uniref:Glycosyl hydrolase n=1 Tax=Staphylotrichum tortipilum TaxID=2831512 RepID=A0AAN6MBI2_9PEZI|nr:glycosyl hydrolase [Staphylotrichum longicolle]